MGRRFRSIRVLPVKLPTLFLLLFVLTSSLRAEGLKPSLSDWGAVGLLQTPTARFLPQGFVTSGFSQAVGASGHLVVTAVPLPGLELAFRKTLSSRLERTNEPGVDLKLRLLREGEYWPELAIGGRDVTGSGYPLPGAGRFSGEYLVASRRWWDFDLSVGLGWGRFGERAHLANPFAMFGGHFARNRPAGDPGFRGPDAWFTGRDTAFFGGIEWRVPLEGVSLKLEYSSDAFLAERQEIPAFKVGWPVNAGVAWRPAPWLDVGAGFEQGRRAMFRVTATIGPETAAADETDHHPPRLDARPPPDDAAAGTAAELMALALTAGVTVRSIRTSPKEAVIWIDAPPDGGDTSRDVGRAARILAALALPGVDEVTVVAGRNGRGETAVALPRAELLRAMNGHGSAEEVWRTVRFIAAPPVAESWSTAWRIAVAPTVEQSLFEHSLPSVHRAYTDLRMRIEPARGLVLAAGTRVRTSDNTVWLNTALLPAARPVRSDLPLYAARPYALEHAYIGWIDSPAPSWTVRTSVGLLEEMFGGLSAEALYHPVKARWAIGFGVDHTWKREPGAASRLAGSPRTSGMVTAYLEAPGRSDWWAGIGIGRFLGRDWGGTAELVHDLPGNLRLGVFTTWSDGPRAEQNRLGGSHLDFGLSVSVPFGRRLSLPVDGRALAVIRTLGRDAGQRLAQPLPLYPEIRDAGYGRIAGSWNRLMR